MCFRVRVSLISFLFCFAIFEGILLMVLLCLGLMCTFSSISAIYLRLIMGGICTS